VNAVHAFGVAKNGPDIGFLAMPEEGEQVSGSSQQIPADMGFSSMSEEELGALAELWRWQSLDLDFIYHQQQQQQARS
jgi:hypothetical protein